MSNEPLTIMRYREDSEISLIDSMGNDNGIVAAARVSVLGDKADEDPASASGLINYLMKHRHGTPFEHNAITIRVTAPLFVWREWHRHRIGFSYNEESARYKVLEPVFYLPPANRPMFKVDDWKPGRPKFTEIVSHEDRLKYNRLLNNLQNSYAIAYDYYLDNLRMGFDPGLARDCLPVGIFSTCYVTMNARSLMAFLSLRTHDSSAKFISYPLYEIEQCARKLEGIFEKLFPITYKAFVDNGRVAP